MITPLIQDKFVSLPAYSWQKTAEYPESLENTNYFQERNLYQIYIYCWFFGGMWYIWDELPDDSRKRRTE